MIKGVNLRIYHNPPPPAILASLQEIKDMGADTIALVPTYYVYLAPGTPTLAKPPAEWFTTHSIFSDIGQDPQHPFANTPSMETMYYATTAAKSLGLNVFIKPHIDSNYGAWRGYIQVLADDVDKGLNFRMAYQRWLENFALLAANRRVGLVIGTELLQITRDLGAAFWTKQFEVTQRAVWQKTLGRRKPVAYTYAANWGAPSDGEVYLLEDLWKNNNMNYIGVDAYWPVTMRSVDWGRIVQELGALAGRTGKKVLLTEVGYQNAVGADVQPWGVDCATAQRDDDLQLELANLLLHELGDEEWFAGFLWWEAPRLRVTSEQDACEALGISHEVRPGSELAKVLFS